MLYIGFSKSDFQSRKFYYDDELVLTSNPPRYKITYVDDETDIDYIDCSDVFCLKPVKPKSEQVVKKENKKTITEPTNTISSNIDSTQTDKQVDKISIEQKENILKIDTPNVPQHLDLKVDLVSIFEYKVINEQFVDDINLEHMLNKHGEDGWELCGFNMYRTGISKTNIICILKKNKKG